MSALPLWVAVALAHSSSRPAVLAPPVVLAPLVVVSSSDVRVGSPPTFAAASPSMVPAVMQSDPAPTAPPAATFGASDDLRRDLLVGGVSLGAVASMLTLGTVAWWGDRGLSKFHFHDTGFFETWTYAGGGDKVGHYFANYFGVVAGTSAYEAVGVPHGRAVLYSAALTFVLAQTVELIDGFSQYGFEYGDSVSNLAGWALGVAAELVPAVDDTLGVRVSYVPSPGFITGSKSYLRLINDYTGQIIYTDLKLKGALRLLGVPDSPARYFLVGVNWGTKNYEPQGPDPERRDRERQLGFHVGVNLPAVFDDLQLGGVSSFGAGFFKFITMPFLTVSMTRDLNGDRWFWNFGLANRMTPYISAPPACRP